MSVLANIRKCEVCVTDNAIQKHHITPRSQGGEKEYTADCCVDCGNQIHMLYTNKELAAFGDLKTLLQQEGMKTYIEWKKKHPGGHRYKSSSKVKTWKKFHRG